MEIEEAFDYKGRSFIVAFIIIGVVSVIFILGHNYEIGFFLITLGFAIFSVGLGRRAIIIAKDSDKKVKSIANTNFLRVIGQIEDRRIEIYFDWIKYRRINTWKVLTYVMEANELIEYCDIKKEYRDRFIDLLVKYIELESLWKPSLVCEEISHIFSICEYLFKIKNVRQDLKKQAMEHLRNIMDETKNMKINLNYITKWKSKISEYIAKDEENKNKIFSEVKNQL